MASSTRCRRASRRSTACSAASAPRGCCWCPRRCWRRTRTRPRSRSAGRSPATSAAAPATRTSSRRCAGPRAGCGRRPSRRRSEGRDMTTGTEHTGWLGKSVKRKEDDRFLRGRGNYVDDVKLPGMLHMAILRSPVAHARINSIDTSAAQALPGVVAVVTGELLAQHKLAWMPTLSGDTQAVLATDKVRMQGQEVACVVAEDPYVAHDALELIDVDYEALPAVTTPQAALEEGAPLIRDDKEGQTDNRVYHWEAGNADATERAFADADRVVRLETHYPRVHPAPIECCGCVAADRPAGEVDRGPDRESHLDRLRARLLHGRRARPDERGQDARPPREDA